MNFVRIETASEEETLLLGRLLGETLRGGELLALRGILGAGKTLFTKGIAEGLGLRDSRCVTSPTFVLIQHYECRALRLHHVDAYRLSGAWDLVSVGVDDLLGPGSVTVIEWPERVPELLEGPHLEVRLEILGSTRRAVELEGRHGFPTPPVEILSEGFEAGKRTLGRGAPRTA